MKNKFLLFFLLSFALTSCLGNDDDSFDYQAWKTRNEQYFLQAEDSVDASGRKVFERVVPSWCPGVYTLVQWHNDRSLTAGNLMPMDNSTCDIVYEGQYIDGTVFDNSYTQTTYGDSIARFVPTNLIVGFWATLTQMHVGDSVTCVIPSDAGYGTSSSSILPYSTLIFHLKLKGIHKYELP